MALTVGELVAYTDVDDSAYNRKLDEGEGRFSRFGGVIAKAAAAAALAGAAAVTAFVVDGVQRFAEFQAGMNEVFTLLPGISEQAMGQMIDDTRAFVVEMGVAHEQAVPALYQALSAGVPPDNVFEFMQTAAKAARGGVTDLETAVDGITSTVNAYGAEALSAEQASDLMFTTVRLGKTTFGELSASLFQVNPVASALGVNFGDVTAALAAMTAQGVPTSVATTQLRQALVEMSKEGTKTSDLFQKLTGKSFKDFIAGGGNVQQALQALEEHAGKTGVGINDLFGSVEAGGAALALTGGGTEKFSQALAGMQDSAGATDAAYQTMERGLSRSWERIKIAFQDAALGLGQELEPAIADVADWLADKLPGAIDTTVGFLKDVVDVVQDANAFYQEHKTVIEVVASVLAGVAVAIAAVSAATKAWIAVQTLLNFVLTANPIGLVVVAIGALVGAFIWAYKNSETFRDVVNGVFDVVKRSIGNAVGFIVEGFRGMLNVWLTVADGIVSGAAAALGWIPGLGGKLKQANAAFDTMKAGILATLDGVADAAYGFGENTSSGFARGISAKQHEANMAAQRLATSTAGAMRRGLRVESPSKVTQWIGEMVGEGLVSGMDARTSAVAASASRLAGAALPTVPTVSLPAGAVRGGDGGALAGGGPATGQPSEGTFTGDLYLDSGEFLGKVRGVVREERQLEALGTWE